MQRQKPLVLDVDGTFLKTDLGLECFWNGLGRAPLKTLRATVMHLRDRAGLCRELARIAPPRVDLLPLSPEMATRALEACEAGRPVVLAGGADPGLVAALAGHYGFVEEGAGAEGAAPPEGAAKARALAERFGRRGFDYAGARAADRPVWREADRALLLGRQHRLAAELSAAGHPVEEIPAGWKLRDLGRALRPHQWVKNVLLLLPALAAHDFRPETLALVLLGILAFSAAASCIYIVNDLLDLEADRLHETKCRRPFACGKVPIGAGMAAGAVLALMALGVGAALGPSFLAVVLLYMALSLAYSLRLKRMRWVDIATLAALYTIRVVAGAAAGGGEASFLMLVFVFPVFVTLGCVKRMTELARAETDERLPGRGYGRGDRGDLLNMAGIGVVGALVVFVAYSFSAQAEALYQTRWLLWAAALPLAVWLVRMVWLGYRGQQDYDPIVFALRDRAGLGLIFFALSFMFYSAGLWQRWFGF
ncbi:prenyltransferase [Rhodovulum sulfidophilum]|uniref:UbiA family prenyltransferase n=1 Tax=Rhodovulum visakhapatnamense TaxID=364297 RepID=A0ABS1RG75_9RHOB|nr:UbiA family prenyltransferase [Rhodovulum visakhapatnamense]MBL3568131.1 UbiA family prenyltransferase [Rhodovulum visakhapatnamense]MBL3578662.1 UbiA family prenyltransferase [Rhodovulum visakhapatnamense]OLS45334.1 prenyltransferase [Rhodovulum sulfidophilum]